MNTDPVHKNSVSTDSPKLPSVDTLTSLTDRFYLERTRKFAPGIMHELGRFITSPVMMDGFEEAQSLHQKDLLPLIERYKDLCDLWQQKFDSESANSTKVDIVSMGRAALDLLNDTTEVNKAILQTWFAHGGAVLTNRVEVSPDSDDGPTTVVISSERVDSTTVFISQYNRQCESVRSSLMSLAPELSNLEGELRVTSILHPLKAAGIEVMHGYDWTIKGEKNSEIAKVKSEIRSILNKKNATAA